MRYSTDTERTQEASLELQLILDSVPATIWYKDAHNRVLRVNKAAAESLGLPAAEIEGKTCEELFPAGAAAHYYADDLEVMRSSKPKLGIIEPMQTAFGETRWMRTDKIPYWDAKGDIAGVIVFALDITEMRRADDSLRLYAQIVQNMTEGICAVRASDGVIVYVNPRFERMFGYESGELITKHISLVNAPTEKDPKETAREIMGVLERTGEWHGEIRNVKKDGAPFWCYAHVSVFRHPQYGKVFIGVYTDTTESKQAEDRVLRLNRLLRTTSEVDQLVVREKDPEKLIQDICKSLVETRACNAAMIILTDAAGTPHTYAEAGMGDSFQLLAARLKQGALPPCCDETRAHGNIHFVKDRGEACAGCPMTTVWPQHMTLSIRLVYDERVYGYLAMWERREPDSEEQALLVGVADDVAFALHGNEQELQRKRAEEDTRKANLELQKALQQMQSLQTRMIQQERLSALGQMASGIAHDFNNALMPVLGYTDLLLSSPDMLDKRKDTVAMLELVRTGALNASETVRRLREFYRPSDPSHHLAVDLSGVIRDTVAATRPKWKEEMEAKGIPIEIRTEIVLTPPVLGEAHELHRLLTNLIFNAVDAMPHGGSITIRLHPHASGEYAVLEVQDTGVGMSEEVKRRCLEPFFTTKSGCGVGLGLSVSHGIVQRHMGSIEINSELGKGTKVTVRLPLPKLRGPQAQQEEAPPPTALPPIPPLRVLFVDDEESGRTLLSHYLERDGHSVKLAADGREGLATFEAGNFDVVILDRAMPGMSGDELAAAIKARSPKIPVIMITGFGDIMLGQGERPCGVDMIIGKPLTRETLRRGIAQVMAGKGS